MLLKAKLMVSPSVVLVVAMTTACSNSGGDDREYVSARKCFSDITVLEVASKVVGSLDGSTQINVSAMRNMAENGLYFYGSKADLSFNRISNDMIKTLEQDQARLGKMGSDQLIEEYGKSIKSLGCIKPLTFKKTSSDGEK